VITVAITKQEECFLSLGSYFMHPDETKPANKGQGSNAVQIVRFIYYRHRLLLSKQVASVFCIEKEVKAMLL